MKQTGRLSQALMLLSPRTQELIKSISEAEKPEINEIRLRRGGKLSVSACGREYYVCPGGRLSLCGDDGAELRDDDIDTAFNRALGGSVHSFRREIAEGYVTAAGGCRVGFCGQAVISPEKGYVTDSVRDISSVNIRIARQIKGCAEQLFSQAYKSGLTGLLIAGPPSSGKTTVLRDLTRLLSEKHRVSLIDERNEIAASVGGRPQNDVGPHTDVFSSYDKYSAIMTAVRVMSPQVIVCDEIGSRKDLEALGYALGSGVCIAATCHAASYEQVCGKKNIKKLIRAGAFGACAVLGTGPLCGKLVSFSLTGAKADA